MGSRNGTYIGHERIGEGPAELLSGRSVLIGSFRMLVAGENTAFMMRNQDQASEGIPNAEDYLSASAQDTNA